VPVQFPLKLIDRRMLAPTVGHYQFLRDDGQPLDFQPGQFIQVHFEYADGTATKRSYSWPPSTITPWSRAKPLILQSVSCPVAPPRPCSRAWTSAAT
jgi:hypothetical protein